LLFKQKCFSEYRPKKKVIVLFAKRQVFSYRNGFFEKTFLKKITPSTPKVLSKFGVQMRADLIFGLS
jgi:hypothetical protein